MYLRRAVLRNTNFRKEYTTSKNMQIVLMNLIPGERIPREVHTDTDQLFYVIRGRMTILQDHRSINLGPGQSWIVPMKAHHTIIQKGKTPLKFFTVYSPPHHPKGTILKRLPKTLKQKRLIRDRQGIYR